MKKLQVFLVILIIISVSTFAFADTAKTVETVPLIPVTTISAPDIDVGVSDVTLDADAVVPMILERSAFSKTMKMKAEIANLLLGNAEATLSIAAVTENANMIVTHSAVPDGLNIVLTYAMNTREITSRQTPVSGNSSVYFYDTTVDGKTLDIAPVFGLAGNMTELNSVNVFDIGYRLGDVTYENLVSPVNLTNVRTPDQVDGIDVGRNLTADDKTPMTLKTDASSVFTPDMANGIVGAKKTYEGAFEITVPDETAQTTKPLDQYYVYNLGNDDVNAANTRKNLGAGDATTLDETAEATTLMGQYITGLRITFDGIDDAVTFDLNYDEISGLAAVMEKVNENVQGKIDIEGGAALNGSFSSAGGLAHIAPTIQGNATTPGADMTLPFG